MRDHPIVPIVAVTAYAVLIFGGQYAMKDRKPWNLRGLMALWNLSLSVFSWIGMFRTMPQLMHNLYYSSLRDNLCMDRKFFFFGPAHVICDVPDTGIVSLLVSCDCA